MNQSEDGRRSGTRVSVTETSPNSPTLVHLETQKVRGEEARRQKQVFLEIMAENFLNLVKRINSQIRGVQQTRKYKGHHV